jgi:hypothetical protein
VHYAFKSTTSEDKWTEWEKKVDESKKYQDEIKALTAQLKEYTTAYTARWSGPRKSILIRSMHGRGYHQKTVIQ